MVIVVHETRLWSRLKCLTIRDLASSKPTRTAPIRDSKGSDIESQLKRGVHRRQPNGLVPGGPAVTRSDIEAAMRLIRRSEPATPLVHSRSLSRRYRRDVYLKLESLSPVRSFKHRGAIVAVDAIATRYGRIPVYTASTGNHGQGVAYACAELGMEAVVCVPESALTEKVEAIRALGARIHVVGEGLSNSQEAANELARRHGAVYLEDGEDPSLMAGASTVLVEILEDLPNPGSVLVPVGGGNLVAGTLLAAADTDQAGSVIGVQSSAAPAATESWLATRVEERDCTTFAGGLATERPGRLALDVMSRHLEMMALVDEADLWHAIDLGFRETGLVFEGAAAAPLAALDAFSDELTGDTLVLIVSGGWLSPDQLTRALRGRRPESTSGDQAR